VLAVVGTTSEGTGWAARALVAPELRIQLSGNIAVVSDDQILSGDTRLGFAASDLLATAVPPIAIEPLDMDAVPKVQRPGWILPTIALAGALLLLVIAIVVFSALRRRRRRVRL
jgi:hypothetical protein